jgi:hypothetical protein
MNRASTRSLAALLAALLLISVPSTVQGQDPTRARSPRVPVTVALVQRLPVQGEPYVLMRRAGETPRDVILLPADATPEVLSTAVSSLLTVRLRRGDVPARTEMVRLSSSRGGRAQPRFPWTPRVMADLRRAAPAELAGVGRVPSVEIWLPRQQRRPR